MFKFLKKKFFTFFTENDKDTNKLSQPKSVDKTNMSSDEKKNRNKKIIKKIVILVVTLGILALIIAPIAVSCTRKNEIHLSENFEIKSGISDNEIIFVDNKNEYTVNLSDKDILIASYYRNTSNQLSVYLKTVNNTLPIVLDITILRTLALSNDNKISTIYNFSFGDKYSINYTNSNDEITGQLPVNINSTKLVSLCKVFISAQNIARTMPQSFDWLSLLVSLIPTIVIVGIFLTFFALTRKQMSGGVDSVFGMGKSNVKDIKTNVKFTDVAGIDEVKEELKELVDYVRNPSKYAAMGARAPKGVILYGPPGTGKTLIAKAVAGEANCSFLPTSGSAFDDMLVGVGAKRVRDLFNRARKNAPAIIFIDEIDSVAAKRGKNDIVGGGSGVADQTINQLLAEMDGFTTDTGVIVIAATNRIDVLDEAILRPGRFDRQIQVSLPDIKGREAILKIHAKNKNLSSDVNLYDIARRTPGFTGAQLENVLNEAAILAVRDNKIVIKTNDIDEAIDRVIGGPARKGRVISEFEKRQIAYHEAGHALVGLHTKNTEVVQKITIIPRGNAAGYTLQTPAEQERVIQTKEDLLNNVRMTLGGRAAEEIIFGKDQITTGASNDLYKVSQIIKAMVLSLGMSKMGLTQFVPSEGQVSPLQQKMYSEETARELDKEIESLIQIEYEKAKNIIRKNKKELDLIVETLMVLETIVKEQIDYIHKNLKLPNEALEAIKKHKLDKSSLRNNSSSKNKEKKVDKNNNKEKDNKDNQQLENNDN